MKKIIIPLTLIIIFGLLSCKQEVSNESDTLPIVSVKITPVIKGDIENNIQLNGKTVYLNKSAITSPISGYIKSIYIKYGDKIKKNDVLYEIQTKEHKALESTQTLNDSLGVIKVRASSDGFVNELAVNETGGYIVEGGLLCNIVENRDLVVQVNVPFEYNTLLQMGGKCKIILPDQSEFEGHIYNILPVINEADQTQNVLIKPNTNRQLPENLNLLVQFVDQQHLNSNLVPKSAIMTNETQTDFWVMKIIKNNIAVKIPITKGISNDSITEILSSEINANDRVICEGAFGLPDSSIVNIVK